MALAHMTDHLLVVEDDPILNAGLSKVLQAPNRQIVSCLDLQTAREHLRRDSVSAVLLDIGLSDGNGLDLLREIKRERPALPVILLTANDTDSDIVNGLEQGADDYITKPFSLSVLRARVNTQLRKAVSVLQKEQFRSGRFLFDFAEMRFLMDGTPVELSKTEQKLLRLLVENQGITMSRDRLIDRIWTDGAEYVDENALSVTVKRLRDKLRAHGEIKTVYGIGYVWVRENGR